MVHYTSDNPEHIGTVVFLDGVEIKDASECDTEKGWVVRATLDDDGKMFCVGEHVAEEKVYGVVTVREP